MNAGGLVLVVVGLWVVCQVLGGNALERLGVVDAESASDNGSRNVAPGQPQPGPGMGNGFAY